MAAARRPLEQGLWTGWANQARMVLFALLLVTLALAACAFGVRLTLRRLGLRVMDTLLYLGLAEVPPPKASRRAIERDRAAATRGTRAPLRVAS